MPEIEIDFEVWKALTNLRRSETHTYNQVIRELLDIDTAVAVRGAPPIAKGLTDLATSIASISVGPATGIALRGLILPNGTKLRATHKGSAYGAQIVDGKWVNEDGKSFGSPSAAATAITGTNVNGWRFWQVKRPSDSEWRLLDSLPKD